MYYNYSTNMIFLVKHVLNTMSESMKFDKIKDYCITGRANPIFCAVGLR